MLLDIYIDEREVEVNGILPKQNMLPVRPRVWRSVLEVDLLTDAREFLLFGDQQIAVKTAT